jgi:signal transduction histidine kinase
MLLPRRLRSLTIAFSVAFVVVTVGTGFAVHSVTRDTIADLVDQRIVATSSQAIGPDPRPDAAAVLARIAELTQQRDTGDIGFQLDDPAGRRLGGNITLRHVLPLGSSSLRIDAGITGLSEGRAFVRVLANGLRLTTVAETEPFDHYNAARVRIYLVGFGSIMLVAMGGVIAFSVLVHRRIAAMRHTVEAIIDGDIQRRVPVIGAGGEFDQQALAFNRMLDRIAELMAQISNVSNDIAHDLRTPLARLRSRVARLLRQSSNPTLSEGLEAALAQCDQLLAMFTAMLRIAEVEGGNRRAAFAPIDLAGLVREVGGMMEPIVADTGRALVVAGTTPTPVRGDRQLLSQALINLIENGVRHTPPGSRIRLATRGSNTQAIVTIEDDGPGIPTEQRALALRRFGRLDSSRSGADGHGLGLPLVDAIARLHRGTLALEDAAPGLRVVLTLPTTPPVADA